MKINISTLIPHGDTVEIDFQQNKVDSGRRTLVPQGIITLFQY
jgi:hypothetical protein